MILDDGGDLTNMVHEKYPQFLDGIKVELSNKFVTLIFCFRDFQKRQQLGFTISTK